MKTVMVIAGKLNMPYEIISWFTEIFDWHFFSSKPDMAPYLDAMSNGCVFEDESSAVRVELGSRNEKIKRRKQTHGR